MKVVELYNLLKGLPADAKVVMYDSEWGEYDEVLSAKIRTADVSVDLTDPKEVYLYPEGDTPKVYKRKTGTITIVEIISMVGRNNE